MPPGLPSDDDWRGPRSLLALVGARDRGLAGRIRLLRLLLLLRLLRALRDRRLLLRMLMCQVRLIFTIQGGVGGESGESDGDGGCELVHGGLGPARIGWPGAWPPGANCATRSSCRSGKKRGPAARASRRTSGSFGLVVRVTRGHDLPGDVVPVLLRPEPAPTVVEDVRILRAEDALDGGVAIGDMRARDLVVSVVLAEAGVRGIDRRGWVAPFGEPADELHSPGVIDRHVEGEARVERIALRVQRVAGVLHREQFVPGEEIHVVQPRDGLVALVEERDGPVVGGRIHLDHPEDRSPAACRAEAGRGAAVLHAGGGGVAGLVEEELAEVSARAEDSVLGPLEGRSVRGLRGGVGVERSVAVYGGVGVFCGWGFL